MLNFVSNIHMMGQGWKQYQYKPGFVSSLACLSENCFALIASSLSTLLARNESSSLPLWFSRFSVFLVKWCYVWLLQKISCDAREFIAVGDMIGAEAFGWRTLTSQPIKKWYFSVCSGRERWLSYHLTPVSFSWDRLYFGIGIREMSKLTWSPSPQCWRHI